MTVAPKKTKGGFRPGAGRKALPKAPDVGDKQFAARVLGHIGQARWRRMYDAIEAHDSFAARHLAWSNAAFAVENFPKLLKRWEVADRSDRGDKPVEPPKPGAEPKRPPAPKTLVENDEDLALLYLLSHDQSLSNRTFINFIEKRDGKAMHNVNHLHDKPIEVNHTFKLAEEMREARLRVIEGRKKK